MADRIEELQRACQYLEDMMPYLKDDPNDDVFNTALTSMKFELEFCFNVDEFNQTLEIPEDW